MGYAAPVLDLQVLGLLHDGPLHGYELRRRIDELTGSARQVSDGTLYPALRRLERDGYVTRHEEPGSRGRTRQVLTLTDAGRTRLHTLLREVSGPDLEDMPRFMMVLAFLSCLPDETQRLAVLRRRLACLEDPPGFFYDDTGHPVRAADEPDPYRRGMLVTAAAARRAEMAWLRERLALP